MCCMYIYSERVAKDSGVLCVYIYSERLARDSGVLYVYISERVDKSFMLLIRTSNIELSLCYNTLFFFVVCDLSRP